jgi:putative SOS response-associated peptidase YedK
MCSRYEAPTPERLQEEFGVEFDAQEKLELWPGYAGPFLRKPRNVDPYDDAVLPFEAEVGVFGLLPFWADKKLARSTYNARSETASVKRSFREAWKKAQHCIIPAVAIYEPDWRTGKAIPTRISRADGRLLGIAGLWEVERQPFLGLMSGLTNYTMADELRVKQALDIAVATGDLLAVDKNGKTRRRKGTSIKSTDILIAPPQRRIFFVPPLKKSSSEN